MAERLPRPSVVSLGSLGAERGRNMRERVVQSSSPIVPTRPTRPIGTRNSWTRSAGDATWTPSPADMVDRHGGAQHTQMARSQRPCNSTHRVGSVATRTLRRHMTHKTISDRTLAAFAHMAKRSVPARCPPLLRRPSRPFALVYIERSSCRHPTVWCRARARAGGGLQLTYCGACSGSRRICPWCSSGCRGQPS